MGLHLHLHLRLRLHLRQPSMACLYLFITHIILVSHVPIPVSAESEEYKNCSALFRCGDIDNIGFPFWGENRPEYCGHPEFKLDCREDAPEMKINGITYKVRKINNASREVTVARDDYWDNLCPSDFVNTSLNSDLFSYTSGTENLTLYYSCPNDFMYEVSRTTLSPFQFPPCSQDEANNYFSWDTNTFNMTTMDAITAYLGRCGERVEVPAQKSILESMVSNPGSANLTRLLQGGFGLEWLPNDRLCDGCEKSGGQCGYAARTAEFTCYSSGKVAGSKFSTGAGVGIGVGSAVVILGLIFFCIRRRSRKTAAYVKTKDLQTPPSSTAIISPSTRGTDSPQSIPSYPYSTADLERRSAYFGAKVFSCTELEEATDNFSSSKQLGDGGFGAVYLGVLRDGRIVAVKRLYESNLKRVDQFMNEVEILTKLQHKNLVKLYGCSSRHSRELLLVYEYIPNGTVADHLHNRQPNSCLLPWHVRLSIAVETADALAYLHVSDVIHRDVKSNNILLDNNFRVKVADFGLSRLLPTAVTHVSTAPQGTPGYVDPEYFQCYKLTDKSDVYSFGVVLVELISGLQAVDTSRHRYDVNLSNMAVNKIQNQALNELVDPSLGFEKDADVRNMVTSVAELAFRCLQQDREMRPTMKEALEILREIKGSQTAHTKGDKVVDIPTADDAVLLKTESPPFSPDESGTGTDKWVSSSNPSSSF